MLPEQENRVIRRLIASALYEKRIPDKRLHLFGGISKVDCDILHQLEKLATIGVSINGFVELNNGRTPAFKAARTVFSVLAVDLVDQLNRIIRYASSGQRGLYDNRWFYKEFKIARLVLSIDRRWNWLSQMTIERLCAAVKGLNTYCPDASLQRSHTSELLSDFRNHVSHRPKRKIYKPNAQQQRTHL